MIQRRLATNNPMMLMGDFNDVLDHDRDGILSHLTMNTLRFNSDPQAQDIVKQFSLQDSWHLYQHAANGIVASSTPAPRPATHYFYNKGSVLDYILLSCEFNAEYQRSRYEVSDYHTYDRHLINPIYERDSESTDHAVVQINLQ